MTEDIVKAGSQHVNEVRQVQRRLVERALHMRCLSYLSQVKARLLTETIFEIDQSKKSLLTVNREMARQRECIAHQKTELEAKNSELERIRRGLERRVAERTAALSETNQALRAEIEERKRLEDELRSHREQLEEVVAERTAALTAANRELEAFSYAVSHDLRAPLRAIDGFSLALLEDWGQTLNPEAKDYLLRVRNAAGRMDRLINDLLQLACFSRGKLRRARVSLSAIATEIAQLLRQAQPEREAELHVARGLKANADKGLVRVVLGNLFDNAWKFSAARGRTVIEFGALARDEETIFYVRDNGAGFDMAQADRLFDAFQRLHREEEFQGTGIGLATVQRIILRHGGRVWAESAPDRGATFYFTLCPPRPKARPPAAAAKDHRRRQSSRPAARANKASRGGAA